MNSFSRQLKYTLLFLVILKTFSFCRNEKDKTTNNNIFPISNLGQQQIIFSNIFNIINNKLPSSKSSDSIAFLILPVEASCPSCRRKTIDSIMAHLKNLDENHYVIISGTSYRKIESYFTERNHKLPISNNNIFIDSSNQAFIKDLAFTKPVIYYSYNKKAFLKITCVPLNVKEQLNNFFTKKFLI